jgi:hypothetical protein
MVDDVDWGKLPIRPPSALCQSYQQSHLVGNQEDLGERNDEFCLWNISFISTEFFMCCKIL